MVLDASGQISKAIELRDHAAKKGSGRLNSDESRADRRPLRLAACLSWIRARGPFGTRRPS